MLTAIFTRLATGFKRTSKTGLNQILLLVCMLAYVLIPHQGDFLDNLTLSPELQTAQARQIEIQNQTLSPFQAVIQGVSLTQKHLPHSHAQTESNISHPENITTSRVFEFQAPDLSLDLLPLVVLFLSPQLDTPPQSEVFPPPLTRQLESTILLI
jgi:hypothetical protein